METRFLGSSGFQVPVLGLGVGTFGGKGPLFSAWGTVDAEQARRMVDRSLDAGVSLFDSADVYSDGASEELLGAALQGRRQRAIISTKLSLRAGEGPNQVGASRHHLIAATDAALRRLRTDHIDILSLHHFDARTSLDHVVDTLDDLVRAGKVRLLGASNFSGWQLMKSLAVADRRVRTRLVSHQVYYSLIGRDYEWELMPLALEERIGAMVWSPLGWGRLTGKLRQGQPPSQSRLHATERFAPPVEQERLLRVLAVLEALSAETGKSVPQLAINWLLQRPTVSTVLIGARDEAQLEQNLAAVGWSLTPAQRARLDDASATTPPYPYYPYWNGQFSERTPAPV
ncbi:MAG: aldo/keto reductase [Polyangiales bacterium]